MGTQSKRRKGTKDQRQTSHDLKREKDQDAMRTAIAPTFEGLNYTNLICSQISFVNVWDTLGPETSALPQRLSKSGRYLYKITGVPPAVTLQLQLDGNFTDSSGNSNPVLQQGTNGFVGSGKFGTNAWRCNYPSDPNTDLIAVGDGVNQANNGLVSMVPGGGFSISLWIFPQDISPNTGNGYRRVIAWKVDQYSGNTPVYYWRLEFDPTSGIMRFVVKDSTGFWGATAPVPITAGAWYHVVGVYDTSSGMSCYVNRSPGSDAGFSVINYVGSGTDYRLSFGYMFMDIDDTHFEGYYDAIQYFNFALNYDQVNNLFQYNTYTPPAGRVSKTQTYLYDIFSPGYQWAPYGTANGSNDLMWVGDRTSIRCANWTISCWINASTLPASNAVLLNKGGYDVDTSGQNLTYGIRLLTDGRLRAGFEESDGTDHNVTASGDWTDGVWHLVVASYNHTTLAIYVDDMVTPKDSVAATQDPEQNAIPFVAGRNARDTNGYLPAGTLLDEYRLWNRALTQAERQGLWDTGTTPTSGCIVYYDNVSFVINV